MLTVDGHQGGFISDVVLQVAEEVGSPSTFTDLRFSNDGKFILGVVENKVGEGARGLGV